MGLKVDENSFQTINDIAEVDLDKLDRVISEFEKNLASMNDVVSALDTKASIYLGFSITISLAVSAYIFSANMSWQMVVVLVLYLFALLVAAMHSHLALQLTEQFQLGFVPKSRDYNYQFSVALSDNLGAKNLQMAKLDQLDSNCSSMEGVVSKKSSNTMWAQNIFFYASYIAMFASIPTWFFLPL